MTISKSIKYSQISRQPLSGASFVLYSIRSQIARLMGPTWGPPGSCRPQVGPILAPWTLLSGVFMRYLVTFVVIILSPPRHVGWSVRCCISHQLDSYISNRRVLMAFGSHFIVWLLKKYTPINVQMVCVSLRLDTRWYATCHSWFFFNHGAILVIALVTVIQHWRLLGWILQKKKQSWTHGMSKAKPSTRQ